MEMDADNRAALITQGEAAGEQLGSRQKALLVLPSFQHDASARIPINMTLA
jgi:hypothetical protein